MVIPNLERPLVAEDGNVYSSIHVSRYELTVKNMLNYIFKAHLTKSQDQQNYGKKCDLKSGKYGTLFHTWQEEVIKIQFR